MDLVVRLEIETHVFGLEDPNLGGPLIVPELLRHRDRIFDRTTDLE